MAAKVNAGGSPELHRASPSAALPLSAPLRITAPSLLWVWRGILQRDSIYLNVAPTERSLTMGKWETCVLEAVLKSLLKWICLPVCAACVITHMLEWWTAVWGFNTSPDGDCNNMDADISMLMDNPLSFMAYLHANLVSRNLLNTVNSKEKGCMLMKQFQNISMLSFPDPITRDLCIHLNLFSILSHQTSELMCCHRLLSCRV